MKVPLLLKERASDADALSALMEGRCVETLIAEDRHAVVALKELAKVRG